MQYSRFSIKETLCEFEKARCYYKNLFLTTTEWKEKPTLVDVHTKNVDEGELTYRGIFRDLYISGLEDLGDNRDYWVQVEEFEKWYDKMGPDLIHYLAERLFLQDVNAIKSRKEAEEIKEKYFFSTFKVIDILVNSRYPLNGQES